MKKLSVLVIAILMLISTMGCTSQNEEKENLKDTEQQESQKEETNKQDDNKEDLEEKNPLLYVNTLEGLVDLSNVENIASLTYEAELEGDYSALVKVKIKTQDDEIIDEIEYQSNMHKDWYEEYTANGGEIVRFFDINFDGYTDLVMQFMGAMPNQSYAIWLYNPQKEQFEINYEYDTLINPKVEINNKLILSSNYSLSSENHELFQVIDGHLALLGQVEISENPKYIEKMYVTLVNNEIVFNEVQSLVETNELSEISELWGKFSIK